jgi:hypothetical protein
MYSKSPLTATAVTGMLAMALLASCGGLLPWRNEPVGEEVNLVFSLEKNLVVLPSATIDGRSGRFLFGSAEPRTLVDPKFARSGAPAAGRTGPQTLQLNDKTALRMVPVDIDLRGVGDAIIGSDVWGAHAVTLDYRTGVLTYQKEGIHPELMTLYAFSNQPTVNVLVDGRSISAVVDTASPDTLILPRGTGRAGRRMAHVQVGGTDFGTIDVDFADVTTPRIGNRLLSKFLVTIDFGKHRVGLWRDPRIAL